MTQVSDVSLANQGFSAFRTELNNILAAFNTSHAGSSAPASLAAGSMWLDTSGGAASHVLKFYDGTHHITFATINTTANTVDFSDSSVSVSDDSITLAKMASGTDGNIISYDASGNPVAVATGSDGQVLTSAGAGAPPAFETIVVPDNSVTLAKMAGGTDGNIISYDTSGDPVAVATGTSGQVLTSAGAGAVPTFADAAGGGITGADQWRVPSDFTGQAQPITSLERVDTFGFGGIGTAMSEGSGSFTFPATGIWLITANGFFFDNTDSRFNDIAIYTTTNNSSYNLAAYGSQFIQLTNSDNALATCSCSFMFDVTNTTTHKVQFYNNVDETGVTTHGDSSANKTHFTFVRLGDT